MSDARPAAVAGPRMSHAGTRSRGGSADLPRRDQQPWRVRGSSTQGPGAGAGPRMSHAGPGAVAGPRIFHAGTSSRGGSADLPRTARTGIAAHARRRTPRTTKRPKELVGGPASRLVTAPNKSGVVTLRPRPSLGGLATIEPGSRDRPEDRSSDRSGGSHLPLRARRNVSAGASRPQPPYPPTSQKTLVAYPRLSRICGRHVDDPFCKAPATSAQHRCGVDSGDGGGRWRTCSPDSWP
jgi:hypothetical protein